MDCDVLIYHKSKRCKDCFHKSTKGRVAWNKGTGKGKWYTCLDCGKVDSYGGGKPKRCWNCNIRHASGERASNWKGDKVGYNGLHTWVRKTLGTPKKCEECGTEEAKLYDWANVSRKYRREVTDWKRLCRKCHIIYDRQSV